MGSVLVNQIEPAVILGNNIRSVMLADIIKLRKLRQTGLAVFARSIQLLCRGQASARGQSRSRLAVSTAVVRPRPFLGPGEAAAIRGRAFPGLWLRARSRLHRSGALVR
ncbi:hypothetical protein D3C73_1457550 [compost metagenome]